MKEIIYNKLVRDKIPQIIENSNKKCEIELVDRCKMKELLNKKLVEEVNEYLESGEIEEIADILEVIHGILCIENVKYEELEDIRINKKDKRGGFERGIKLIKVY